MLKLDTHQHFWHLEKVDYPWLVPAYGPIYANFEAPDLEPLLDEVGMHKTVIVQAADSYEDTDYMLATAAANDWVAGVVGWLPLLDPAGMARKIEEDYGQNAYFRGIRHLIHEVADPDWVTQDQVIEGLQVLADHDLTFDVVAVFPNHLKHVPTLSERIPKLKMVVDHLAKPPLDADDSRVWREQMAAAAENPNVYAKVSGLNTATGDPENWTWEDIKPWVDSALEIFGADRLMFGSDWPVAILAGTYKKVHDETTKALADLSEEEKVAIWGSTGNAFYGLGLDP
ncbi:MAG: amidohydrolase family protein [Anaerolineae bacterium]|nr:amidohydrolase family protein [Anaerolineae bacterium]